jgi:glycosyltransferase involved in cell wall biosynthesis
MRIALYISPAHCVPPESKSILAPWRLVSDIADGLVKRGHDVTLFSAKGSKTLAKVVDLGIEPFAYKEGKEIEQKKFIVYAGSIEQRLASEMYKMAQDGTFDIINNHWVTRILPFAPLTKIPSVFTLHDPLSDFILDMYKAYKGIPQISYISISNAQRAGSDLPFAGTVYHGLPVGEFPFEEKSGDHLIIVGRIRKEKGITQAIEVAKRTNIQLLICGEYFPQYPQIFAYWEKEVKPSIDNVLIFYKGLLAKDALNEQYKKSKAFIFPLQWEEPFGMVMIEAMACGTPVVAYNRGSVSEIVRDSVTGFIIDPDNEDRPGKGSWSIKKQGIEGLIEAVKRIGEIDRRACRKHVEDNFSVEKMVLGYENVYKKILGKV